MNVLQEILQWSGDRPAWQRDALRRLVLNGNLTEEDVIALSNICKGGRGIIEPQSVEVLSGDHLPHAHADSPAVSLESIFHHRGVNALAENQTVKFSPTLTVVYGDNGAGKTGYIRILKEACRSRGKEKLLGNLTSGQTPLSPAVSIKYRIGDGTELQEWTYENKSSAISRVSVFDTQSAAVYLTERTDVAFRPFGLDLFDKLVKGCKAVRAKLEAEQKLQSESLISYLQELIPTGTRAGNMISNITSLTDPDAVKSLATLSLQDEERMTSLEKTLVDLQANDQKKLIQELSLRNTRLKTLEDHITRVQSVLSTSNIQKAFEIRSAGKKKADEARNLYHVAFPEQTLPGTGLDGWKALWEAARVFSQDQAYTGQRFPVTTNGSQCVLCQQELAPVASDRLKRFEEFVVSTTERELTVLRGEFVELRSRFTDLKIFSIEVDSVLSEIQIENQNIAATIKSSLAKYQQLQSDIIEALKSSEEFNQEIPVDEQISNKVKELSLQLSSRIKTLQGGSTDQVRAKIATELNDLKTRKQLNKNLESVLKEIDRQKRFAAYNLCMEETTTQQITRKSSTVTREVVSQQIKDGFTNELKKLQFKHAEVELKEDGGADGVLYHKLVLTRAPGVNLQLVASEGEQRCLSIASFFAELSTASDHSGIVFDDPISSLDFKWRESVARRLVEESKVRQVIVFTHDVVFLLLLKQFADELQVTQFDQHVQRLSKGAGVIEEALPWVAMPVSKKIKFLNNEWQAADKLFRDGQQSSYEKEAIHLYGLLRSAWERALEEVLLAGIVERFRVNIKTQHLETISDITVEECRVLDAAMTKCSKWIAGHDQAAAARAPVPEPSELKKDVEALDAWVNAIRKRRNKN